MNTVIVVMLRTADYRSQGLRIIREVLSVSGRKVPVAYYSLSGSNTRFKQLLKQHSVAATSNPAQMIKRLDHGKLMSIPLDAKEEGTKHERPEIHFTIARLPRWVT